MKLEIIFATSTGNAEMVAKRLFKLAIDHGFDSKIGEMNDYTINKFSKLENVAIITSTYGNGDVPEMGMEFWEELKDSKINLKNQKYGLIALGDSSHDDFCGGGKKISSKLDQLESQKIVEKLECDGGTEGTYEWCLNFLNVLKNEIKRDIKIGPNKTCFTCNNDTKTMSTKLGNREPKEIDFKEAKKIFSPLADKIKN